MTYVRIILSLNTSTLLMCCPILGLVETKPGTFFFVFFLRRCLDHSGDVIRLAHMLFDLCFLAFSWSGGEAVILGSQF